MAEYTSNGGGATHIAKVTGQLKDLSSNLSDILLVSGGGGGGLLVGETATQGQNAGGISGSGTNSGNQSTGYAFGQGESGTNVSGGGAGLYGGNKGTSSISGGAGSGYIGNSLVSNKKMVGYNVPTSSDASTKTESVSVYSATGEADKPKAGNGKAKIKFLRDAPSPIWKNAIAFPDDDTIVNCYNYWWAGHKDYTITELKSNLSSRGNTFLLKRFPNGDGAYAASPYTLSDGSDVYFASTDYISGSGDNKTYYGVNCPATLGVFYGSGSSANLSETFESTGKNNVTYRSTGGSQTYPTYFISSAKNLNVYIDGVFVGVYNKETE